ncbi:hypothetical protein [Roseomonas chloroacetimidivorans]|uniref:hypothetical protein n=1 Tax=Roseomonas chloroacetimidivorans TaxID=1766656 RepID=UPI003C75931A
MQNSSSSEPPAWLLLLIVLVGAALHLLLASKTDIMQGRLPDTDSYVRVMRIDELWRSGAWYAEVTPRLNAPEGLSLHWTRPLDILALGPALVAHAIFGIDMRAGIFWSAALLCPVLHLLCVPAAIWAARAVWPATDSLFAGLLILTQPVAMTYSMVGRSDHHTLVLLCAVILLGAGLRALMDPGRHHAALLAGAASGLGVWVSPEALLVVTPVLAGFGLFWWWAEDGAPIARQGSRIALGMLAVILLAIATERPPSAWLDGDYDKVSIQHALAAGLAAMVFFLASLFRGGRLSRLAAGTFLCGVAAGMLLFLYPAAASGSMAAADQATATLFLPFVGEMQPLRANAEGELAVLVHCLGAVPAAGLVLLLGGAGWRDGVRGRALVLLGLTLAACTVAAILHRRFALDLAAPASLLGAGLLTCIQSRLAHRHLRLMASILAPSLLLFAPPALARWWPEDKPAVQACRSGALSEWLNQEQPGHPTEDGKSSPIIMSNDMRGAPELAWRTSYRFVVAPYHRGGHAFADTRQLLDAANEDEMRAVLLRRQARYLLFCTQGAPERLMPAEGSFGARLLAGTVSPEWAHPVSLPEPLTEAYSLFELSLPEHREAGGNLAP